jgi:hypothetical protein
MKISRLLGAITLAVILPACGSKPDAQTAATHFFELLAKKQVKEAYESAAFSFQTAQNLKTFELTADSLGIQNVATVKWTDAAVGNREATLKGEISKANGGIQKVTVVMIREGGEWKLHSLRTPSSDPNAPEENQFTLVGKGASFNEAARRALPPQAEIEKLVKTSLLDFNAAIQKGDFRDFYKTISLAWQSKLAERKLQSAFQPFIDAGARLDGVVDVQPVFDPSPEINGEGLLVVSGYYPTKPFHVTFTMNFTYELPNWKLYGLTVNLVQPQ